MSTARVPGSLKSKKKDFTTPLNPESPEAVLSQAQASRAVIQDFVPLAESLEWELGQEYLRERGNKAFISDASPVPFVINNDGTLSRNAAEVFFASLVEAEKAGTLEPDIFVLELGIGVGLFARFFLDNLRELCFKNKKDYYERLCYIAADRSQRMLLDVLRHGVLRNHAGHYLVRQLDALEPDKLASDAVFLEREGKPLRAIFLNYLLDCLPAAVLEVGAEEVKQLCVRTCLARNVRLEDFTDMTLEQIQERAASKDPRDRQELLEVYGLFASEYDYRPVNPASLPYSSFALEYARRRSKRVLHNYGAIQSLEKLLDMVHEEGFILVNDYGQTQVTRDDEFEHQRFSLATFVGVNFPFLRTYFTDDSAGRDGARCQFLEPPGEEKGIHSRLIGKRPAPDTVTRFYERFSAAASEQAQEPLNQARACARAGRFELAANFYREAIKRQPRNWVLLNEVSMFLTFSMRDPRAGIDMAKLALALNPTCSAELWSTLGDALFEFGRTAEAESAYRKALQVNPNDIRARYNLAWVHVRDKDYAAAVQVLAQALAADKTGEYRERIMQKLQEVTQLLTMRNQQEYLRIINLVSKYSKQEDKPPEPRKPAEQSPPEQGTTRSERLA